MCCELRIFFFFFQAEDGIRDVAVTGVQTCALPIYAGLAVVLATDFNPGSSPTPSMPMILSLACTQMKMSPAEAITAATINPAHSLNRGDTIGSLEAGKLANFSIFNCENYRELAYWFGIPQTHSVYYCGKCVSRAGGL